ncbi:hypothetical protein [Aquimarina sp. RZ0]|uniref:hypothetical protein n=1 Tax=Aquimarina sp. RZ0 TaxID=2607730 RepID=UPI0011F2DFCD|nr:hypothetical protein [Aquimarina sp. RZ0]KAA1244250.1 hypothetical protein F0000_17160 [Aquimarina sp. RZ0]
MKILKNLDNYLICYVLIVIAFIQLYNSQFDSLTPWKGGGFGMFSTNKNTNITATGYKKDGDSILINIVSSKFSIPISKNFLISTKNFPKKEKLKKLGKQIINSYLKPNHVEFPSNIDENTLNHINNNNKFYEFVYEPTYYENDATALAEEAIKIERIKLRLFQTDFFENDLTVKKSFIGEIEISN